MFSKDHIAIVMRTFWPISPVVGSGMLRVSEELAADYKCRVITQNQSDIHSALKNQFRGQKVNFSIIFALSNSSSSLLIRVLDLIWFGIATFITLILKRPKLVYVATDPPLFVPFLIYLYSKMFRARYIYHVQDIHPEASAIILPNLRGQLYRLLLNLDSKIVISASSIITLTQEMVESLQERINLKVKNIYLVNNPAANISKNKLSPGKRYDFCFVGNLGRFQRLSLIIESITNYLSKGGKCKFAFAGAGIYSKCMHDLSNRFPKNVIYFGRVGVDEATNITMQSNWALLSINDDVCRYAFPSKASTYALSKARILGVCNKSTSVARWIMKFNLGIVVTPKIYDLVNFYNEVENGFVDNYSEIPLKEKKRLEHILSEDTFVTKIKSVFINNLDKLI